MTNTIVLTIVILTLVGLVLALVLFWVAKKFKVEEDPRIDEVEKVMPGANCGGCGFAGCRAFADAAVKAPDLDSMYCPVGGDNVMKKVAGILGYEVKAHAPRVAVVRCNGSCANRPKTLSRPLQDVQRKAARVPLLPGRARKEVQQRELVQGQGLQVGPPCDRRQAEYGRRPRHTPR